MSEQFKKVLIAVAIPVVIMLLFLLAPDNEGAIAVGTLALLVPFVYFVVGIILLFTSRKQLGQVLLISCGIIFLIGFSICTMTLSLNFH